MLKSIHYYDDQIATKMEDKTTVRFVIDASVKHDLKRRILDIKCAFPHGRSNSHEPTYVSQTKRFDGSYKHKGIVGVLILNLYGGKEAPYIYYKVLADHLLSHRYT